MATVLSHLGYKVWVTCDDAQARIHGPEYGPKTATCWIQSEAGKHFEVHVEATDLRHAVSCYAYVDGVEVGGRVLERGHRESGTFRGLRTGRASVKRMYFSNLTVSDLEDQVTAMAVQDLGSIRVEVRRVRVHGNMQPTLRPQNLPDGSIVVHEKAKKLGGHHASLGEEVFMESPVTVGVEELDKDPHVTFILQYRPHDILRAQGIIGGDERPEVASPPRSNKRPALRPERDVAPSSSAPAAPDSAKRIKAEHSEESIESLKARIRELEARLPEEARTIVKTEQIHAHLHFVPGEIVDLTADDSD